MFILHLYRFFYVEGPCNLLYLSNNHFLMLLFHLHRWTYLEVGHIFGIYYPRIWCQLSHALEKEMATHSSDLARESQGRRSLVGCRLWGRTESDTTEAT